MRALTPAAVEAATLRIVGTPSAPGSPGPESSSVSTSIWCAKIGATFGPDALAPRRAAAVCKRRPEAVRLRFGRIPFTGRAKRCMELTLREAQAMPSGEIGVEHIALALTATTGGIVPEIFAAQGASASGLHTKILDRYRQAG